MPMRVVYGYFLILGSGGVIGFAAISAGDESADCAGGVGVDDDEFSVDRFALACFMTLGPNADFKVDADSPARGADARRGRIARKRRPFGDIVDYHGLSMVLIFEYRHREFERRCCDSC